MICESYGIDPLTGRVGVKLQHRSGTRIHAEFHPMLSTGPTPITILRADCNESHAEVLVRDWLEPLMESLRSSALGELVQMMTMTSG